MKTPLLLAIIFLLTQTACRSSIERTTGSSTLKPSEMKGVEKKELLKDRVVDAKNAQKATEKTLQAALADLKALNAANGKNLEKKYRALQFNYEDAVKNADQFHQGVQQVESLAQSLYSDWESDINKIDTVSLKTQSQQSLAESRSRYEMMDTQFKSTEEKLMPVLKKYNDQIRYLKYNLDSKSLASVRNENKIIQSEMEQLIHDLNKSVASADDFIRKMPTN
jgi:hypothetical protein